LLLASGDRLLAVLRDEDEGRKEDRLQAHGHGEKVEGEVVVAEALRGDPEHEERAVEVDELHVAAERGDDVGRTLLKAARRG
jgi:hypothetical protein